MHVQFYDDLNGGPKSRKEVRLNELGLFVYEDGRRVAVGFDLTPFLERPSLLVTITNVEGEEAASLSVIEAMEPNFNLTVHLRDNASLDPYTVEAIVYYVSEEGKREVSDRVVKAFDSSKPGEQ
jgi:hypothetical protein